MYTFTTNICVPSPQSHAEMNKRYIVNKCVRCIAMSRVPKIYRWELSWFMKSQKFTNWRNISGQHWFNTQFLRICVSTYYCTHFAAYGFSFQDQLVWLVHISETFLYSKYLWTLTVCTYYSASWNSSSDKKMRLSVTPHFIHSNRRLP
jgi:hypothetical protein